MGDTADRSGGAGPRSLAGPAAVVLWLTLAALTLFGFLSGGYILTRTAPVAIAWLLAAATLVWFLPRQRRPSRLHLAALAALALYTAWAGLSILWSFGPDLSWVAFDYAAFYLAVAAVVGLVPLGRPQLRLAAFGFLAVTVDIALYAFAGKVLPDVVTHAHTYARLDSPVGYWNVLALLMVMALPVGLSLAARREAPVAVRALVAAALVPVAFTFVFCFSRGGVIALAVCLVVYFALSDRRLASLVSLAVVVLPVSLALWRVRALDTLFTATTDDVLRAAQGEVLLHWSLAALVAAVVLQAAAALLHRGVRWPRALTVAAGTAVIGVAVIVVLVGGSWYVARQGGTSWLRAKYTAMVSNSDSAPAGDSAERLLSLNSGRPPLWREAMRQYQAGPAVGTGAGTFRFSHYRFRVNGGVVKHAHSQWLNALSELGWPGLVTFAVATALLLAAAFRGLRRDPRDRERATIVALQAGAVAFVVHLTWDWDWDMAVAATAFLAVTAVAAAYLSGHGEVDEMDQEEGAAKVPPLDDDWEDDAYGDSGRASAGTGASEGWSLRSAWSIKGGPVRALAAALLVAAAVSWVPPYLSDRSLNQAIAEAGADRLVPATAADFRAHRYDPLTVEPLVTLALIEQRSGHNRVALDHLRAAAALQPQNYEVHYQMGLLLSRVYDRRKAAIAEFVRALQLNPLDESSRYEVNALSPH